MSTYTSEPGTRLGGRYRLEDRVAAAGGWAAWKAIDETLARPVTVLTFAPAFPRLREVVTAARAASRLADSRFAQVFDVEDDWDHAYIVSEWPAGETLDDMIAAGPVDPDRGARIVAEAADAISAAHAAGLAHLCLLPSSLRWTSGGGVKITGLGVNAALSGATADDPALADTRSLGMLLYAALTGFWPGPDCPTLPPAPMMNGLLRSPRQVRAGIPAVLDEITGQTLQLRSRDADPEIVTPAELSGALQAVLPPAPIPQPTPVPRSGYPPSAQPADWLPPREPEYWQPDDRDDYGDYDPGPGRQPATAPPWVADRPRGRGAGRGILVGLLAVVVVAGVTAAVVHLASHHGPAHGTTALHSPATTPGSAAAAVLTPASAEALDDNNQNAEDPINGDSAAPWQTHFYIGSPEFGGLQKGSGLLLDMGHPVRLSSLTVTFGPIPGADVQIRIGSAPPPPQASNPTTAQANAGLAYADAMTLVAQQSSGVAGSVTFPVTSRATGQYVLIWFTKLPPMAGQANQYQAQISSVVVKGSSA